MADRPALTPEELQSFRHRSADFMEASDEAAGRRSGVRTAHLFMFAIGVQVVDATMAQALHQDVSRDHALIAWVVSYDDPAFPDRYIAWLAMTGALPYVLVGDTLAAVQEQLSSGLKRSARQPADPPGVVEIWFTS